MQAGPHETILHLACWALAKNAYTPIETVLCMGIMVDVPDSWEGISSRMDFLLQMKANIEKEISADPDYGRYFSPMLGGYRRKKRGEE
jgi:hypothetical protein